MFVEAEAEEGPIFPEATANGSSEPSGHLEIRFESVPFVLVPFIYLPPSTSLSKVKRVLIDNMVSPQM